MKTHDNQSLPDIIQNGLTVSASAPEAGSIVGGLPTYTIADVAKHDSKEKKIWVSYKNGVYDVTDYVSKHPGEFKKCQGFQ